MLYNSKGPSFYSTYGIICAIRSEKQRNIFSRQLDADGLFSAMTS